MRRPLDHPAARQGDRRLVVDQRASVHPRAGGGLRSLAPARQCGLELHRRAAVLPPRRGSAARRGRTARRRRAALGARRQRRPSAVRCVHRCVRAGGPAAHRRFQRRRAQEGAGYFQLTTRKGRRWSTARGYLKPARKRGEPRGGVECADHAHPVRRPPRGRRRVRQGRRDAHRARERRGDPRRAARSTRRSCLQLSGVGPARSAATARHRGDRRHEGRRRRSAGPLSGALQLSLHHAQHHQRHDGQPDGPRRGGPALCAVPQGLPHHRRRLCGRLLQDRSLDGDARRAIPLHPVLGRLGRTEAASVAGLPRLDLPASPREPRLRAHQVGRSGAGACDPAALHDGAGRPRLHGGGHEAAAPRDGPAGDRALHRRGAGAGPEGAERRGLSRVRAPEGHDRIPPDLDLPHGLGRHRRGGRAAARARLRGPARRRRLDHADGRLGQHQRGLRDDRREGLRHDPGGREQRSRPPRRHDRRRSTSSSSAPAAPAACSPTG